MTQNSKIEWTDHTFNPWVGCTKVSDGCKNCYAETLMDKRYGKVQWGPQGTRIRTSAANWKQPFKWNRLAKEAGRRDRVFCASLADAFEDRPELVAWRSDLLMLIQMTPNLDWLLLTKRPENVMRLANESWQLNGGQPVAGFPPNVWIGTSVENQEQADKRIPELLKIPARVRFLSMEPLLEPVNLSAAHQAVIPSYLNFEIDSLPIVDWVIVGGESGPNARPMHPDWVRSIRDQCQAAGAPFFFKQWGEWMSDSWRSEPTGQRELCLSIDGKSVYAQVGHAMGARRPDDVLVRKVGKRAAGRLLDGREWSEFPKECL